MEDDEVTEEIEVDQFEETDVVPESLVRRLQGRAGTSGEWPPPPPRPAPTARRARFYSVARRPTTSGN
jgi:hypothetical protein